MEFCGSKSRKNMVKRKNARRGLSGREFFNNIDPFPRRARKNPQHVQQYRIYCKQGHENATALMSTKKR